MEKLISYKTADLTLFNDYEEALKHEEYLNTNVKEATDKIKFYKDSKEIPVTDFFGTTGSFGEAYSSCDKVAILDTLSDALYKYLIYFHSLRFPSTPGVYKLNDNCEWEAVK